jgi:hypothetical protein
LRKKIETKPCFFLNISGSLKIIQEYHEKYDGIDSVLDKNVNILNAFHSDLEKYGSVGGRESKYSSGKPAANGVSANSGRSIILNRRDLSSLSAGDHRCSLTFFSEVQ